MANYYNVTGWKRTGFDYYNRPINRSVLSQDYFANPTNYFQVQGIAVSRETMEGLTSIRLQGSVKDLTGNQVNPPNSTGVHGPGGPWYSWEEVDYIRLVRTGYPGDPDYVDISNNQLEPWEAPKAGKLFIAYYFVTGMRPEGRDVTTLFLQFDEWTSLGGSEELEIESGFKVRGHITVAEDASSYNLSPEGISTLEPLETKAHEVIKIPGATSQSKEFLVSSINLTQYAESMSVDAFVAQATSGQSVAFPAIQAVHYGGEIVVVEPGIGGAADENRRYNVLGYALFDGGDSKVQHNLSVLYSAGQLELQDSFLIPNHLVSAEAEGGRYNNITSKAFSIKPAIKPEMSYPRKADYLLGKEILYSLTTGDMNIQPLTELTDDTIKIWSIVTPTGSPYARFAGIKGHEYLYDQAVQGMTWVKKAVVLQGASGSMWNQVNNNFAQQSYNRTVAMNETANVVADKRYGVELAQLGIDTTYAGASMAASAFSVENAMQAGQKTLDAAKMVGDVYVATRSMEVERQAELKNREYKKQSLEQAQNQLNAQIYQQNFKAPYTNFVPDLSRQVFADNSYAVYIVNVSSKDRQRLKNYFLRYGYNGLYKPLTWKEIIVKQKVNYIQCESVCLRHEYYPTRVTARASSLLQNGLFLWSEKPNQEAFSNNPDV